GVRRGHVGVVAVGRGAADARSVRTGIRCRAGVAVVARQGIRSADTYAGRAGVAGSARVTVAAGQGVHSVHAARGRVAGIGRAHVAVVAVGRWPAHADAARARIRRGAGVAVVAGQGVRGTAHARGGAVAGAATDAGVVGASLAGCLELAGGRAAVARHEVAVVALIAEVDDAVPAHVRDLADDRAELVGLLPARRKARPLDPKDVRAARAAGDGLVRAWIADQPRRRRGCERGQERPHPTSGDRLRESEGRPRGRRDARAVLGEVHRPQGVGLEDLHPIGVRDRIRAAGRRTKNTDADTGEHDLVAGQSHIAVREGPFEGRDVGGEDGPDGHLADGARVEYLDGKVVREGEGEVRIRQNEPDATTDGVEALLQSEAVRILIVLRETVDGV